MTKPLFDVFRAAMMDNASGSRKEAQDDFLARMKADPAYLEMLATDYFERMAAVWTVRHEAVASTSFGKTVVAADKASRLTGPRAERPAKPLELVRRTQEESKLRTQAAFAELKAKVRDVVLLDILLPNGKALRDATGADCVKAGGFFAEVAKQIKPTQVVDRHLTEGDLQNIRARFYQANAA